MTYKVTELEHLEQNQAKSGERLPNGNMPETIWACQVAEQKVWTDDPYAIGLLTTYTLRSKYDAQVAENERLREALRHACNVLDIARSYIDDEDMIGLCVWAAEEGREALNHGKGE